MRRSFLVPLACMLPFVAACTESKPSAPAKPSTTAASTKPATPVAATNPTNPRDTPPKPPVAAPKPKDLIVGKWEAQVDKEKITWELLADGTLTITNPTEGGVIKGKGTYRFVEDNVMEMVLEKEGKKSPPLKQTVQVSADELTVTTPVTTEDGLIKELKQSFKKVK